MNSIVVVGGGQAGASLVAKLRQLGHDGPITLICEEEALPYQRPPLSKAYLLGEMEEERLYLRPEAWYADNDIKVIRGARASNLDPAAKTITVGNDVLAFDHLALTTGSVPNRLPERLGGSLEGVHVVRTLGDVDAMAPEVASGVRALIVGGGYIGLEAAAVIAKKGGRVTLVELADRILQRVAAPETSDYFRALHQSHGVTIREGTGLDHLAGEGRVDAAVLSDGTRVEVDFVVVGTGIRPNDGLAAEAGLATDNGIDVDEMGLTSAPGIWAAGDCARFPVNGDRIRLESVQNAIDQAEAVAANMLGAATPYVPKPWFWSDQYDVKLQIAGLNTGYDHVVIRPGATEGSRSHWYFEGDTLLAVDAMNAPRDYMIGKRMIEGGTSPTPDQVADPDCNLKALL